MKKSLACVIGDFHRKFSDFAGTRKPLASVRLRNFHMELENEEFFLHFIVERLLTNSNTSSSVLNS